MARSIFLRVESRCPGAYRAEVVQSRKDKHPVLLKSEQ